MSTPRLVTQIDRTCDSCDRAIATLDTLVQQLESLTSAVDALLITLTVEDSDLRARMLATLLRDESARLRREVEPVRAALEGAAE